MTSFTFTAEQLRHAPPEVRRWAVQEIAQALSAAERPGHDPSQVKAAELAACTEEEAIHVFTMIRGNFVLTQVFFEFARDAVPGTHTPPLHPLNTVEMLRHTRLAHADSLLKCFDIIKEAFQQIRRDPEASLFGFDGYGHVYIHDLTHVSIRRLFEDLLKPVPSATSRIAPNPPAPVANYAARQSAPFETGDQRSAKAAVLEVQRQTGLEVTLSAAGPTKAPPPSGPTRAVPSASNVKKPKQPKPAQPASAPSKPKPTATQASVQKKPDASASGVPAAPSSKRKITRSPTPRHRNPSTGRAGAMKTRPGGRPK